MLSKRTSMALAFICTALFSATLLTTTAVAATNAQPDEYVTFARRFVNLATNGLGIDEFFDFETFYQRSCKHLPQQPENERKLRDNLREVARQFIENLDGGEARFLRMREVKGEHRALIRVVRKDILNYVELVCEPRPSRRGREIKVVDVYNMVSGQTFSEAAAEFAFLVAPPPQRRGYLKSDDRGQTPRAILEAFRTFNAGDSTGCIARVKALPDGVQRRKVVLTLRCLAALNVSDAEFIAASRFYRVNFPNDPAAENYGIEAFFRQEKFDLALGGIDRLDAALGGDPHLDLYRSTVYRKLGSNELATAALARWQTAEKAAEAEAGPSTLRVARLGDILSGEVNVVPAAVRMAARSNAMAKAKASPAAPASAAVPAALVKPQTSARATMKLQGVFMRANKPSAIINGKSLSEGDVFDGNKIVKIETARVWLENQQGQSFRLNFQ
jgi:hypothetical protein